MSMEKLDEATTKSVDGPPAQRWLALALMVGGWALYGATMAPGVLFGVGQGSGRGGRRAGAAVRRFR